MLISATGAADLNDYDTAFRLLGTAWGQYFRHCPVNSAAMAFCTEKSAFIFECATRAYPYDRVLRQLASASQYGAAYVTELRSQRRHAAA
jgi:hypothetical protein